MADIVSPDGARDIDPDHKWRYRCPSCGSPTIRRNNPNSTFSTATTQYHCNECMATFDEPIDKLEDE